MKLTSEDLRLVRAALNACINGDQDAWDELSEDDLDRAAELLLEIEDLLGDQEEEDDEDGDDEWL